MEKQDKERIFRRVEEVINNYNFKTYLKRYGAVYIEELEFKLKAELIQGIRKEILE